MSEQKKKVGTGVGIVLERDGKILLGKRHPDPDKAGSSFRSAGEWTLPGGKLEWGESFEEAAIREVKEETGIIISDPKVISVHNNRNEFAHFTTIGLTTDSWKGEAKAMEPDEITEWKWFKKDELPSRIFFPSHEVIENYMRGKFYIRRK